MIPVESPTVAIADTLSNKESKKSMFSILDMIIACLLYTSNPVMFVVELGFFITLVLTIFPTLFGEGGENRIYNGIVTVVLFITVLFANFAESVAEGRGKAQAATLKKTKKDTKARVCLLYTSLPDGEDDYKNRGRAGISDSKKEWSAV